MFIKSVVVDNIKKLKNIFDYIKDVHQVHALTVVCKGTECFHRK